MKRFTLTIILAFTFVNILFPQTFDDYKKQQQAGKTAFKNQMEKELAEQKQKINDYITEKDKEFAEFIKNKWEEFQLFSKKKPIVDPKIKIVPLFKKNDIKLEENEIITNIENKKQINSNLVFQPIDLPILSKFENKNSQVSKISLTFYETPLKFEYDKSINIQIVNKISEKSISDYWEKASKSDYSSLVEQLMLEKSNLNLNDWGYYLLVKDVASQIQKDNNSLLTWFLLIRSGYKVKIGYKNNQTFIMLPSINTLFEKPYFSINNVNYFLIDCNENSIFTYKIDYPNSFKYFNFSLPQNINIKNINEDIKFKAIINDETLPIDLSYNKNIINFFKDYPLTDIGIFYNTKVENQIRESLKSALIPFLENLNEVEAVNLLLHFVQKSFKYKTDDEQFGTEKFFVPEEIFYYPFSDCDDRVSLFSYLVRDLLKLDIIGVEYPGHIATAVKLNGKCVGDHIIYKNQKYIIADPTYIGAPLGVSMPQYKNTKIIIIELFNPYKTEDKINEICYSISENGGIKNTYQWTIDENGAFYISGLFKGNLKISSKEIFTGNNNSIEGFISKFNSNFELEKIIHLKNINKNSKIFLLTTKNGIYASYQSSLEGNNFDFMQLNYELFPILNKKIMLKQDINNQNYLFVAKLNENSEVVWINYIENTKYNSKNTGLTIDNENNLYLKSFINQ